MGTILHGGKSQYSGELEIFTMAARSTAVSLLAGT